MPNRPADPLLIEALDHLAACGVEVAFDLVDGEWRYVLDGEAVTEGDLVAKAVGLGMLANATVQ